MSVEMLHVDLTDAERHLMVRGLREWGGPARSGELMAVALGFSSARELLNETTKLARSVSDHAPLSREDWTRVLLATEVVFVSNVVGSGLDWTITTGFSDSETITVLRAIQRKLSGTVNKPPLAGPVDEK